MLHATADFPADEHLVENGRQFIPFAGTADLESCIFLSTPARCSSCLPVRRRRCIRNDRRGKTRENGYPLPRTIVASEKLKTLHVVGDQLTPATAAAVQLLFEKCASPLEGCSREGDSFDFHKRLNGMIVEGKGTFNSQHIRTTKVDCSGTTASSESAG